MKNRAVVEMLLRDCEKATEGVERGDAATRVGVDLRPIESRITEGTTEVSYARKKCHDIMISDRGMEKRTGDVDERLLRVISPCF
jgi:hypothetical protein